MSAITFGCATEWRTRRAGNPFDAVAMQSLLAVPLKGGKIEYDVNQAASGTTASPASTRYLHIFWL